MPPQTDRERLAHFVQLIGTTPRRTEFDDADRLIKLNLSGLNLTSLPPEIGQFINLQTLFLGERAFNNDEEIVVLGNRLKNLPAEIGQLNQLRVLSLEYNQIDTLPLDITRLTNLRHLHLSNNHLDYLPPEVTKITSLHRLGLTGNHISNLPSELGFLVRLQRLFLGYNELTSLPSEITKITRLNGLFLHNNHFTHVPLEVCQLSNLKELTLSSNKISSLPPQIIKLVNLRRLNLGDLRMQSVPLEVWQLTSLTDLYLEENQLSNLDPSITRLVNLRRLIIPDNHLTSLPLEIAQLTKLEELWAMNNRLNSLPSEIAQLRNLRVLSLNNNHLDNLPTELSLLAKLKKLDLSNNRLRHLPVGLAQMTKLEELSLNGNPLRTPPLEIITSGLTDIANYLRNLAKGSVTRHEAKLLILGEGGSGKSSLLSALQEQQFDQHLSSTHGIDVQRYSLFYSEKQDTMMTLNVWDFGGQQIYHTTHQFFMTKRSLYLLVWNARGDTDQGRLDHWLRSIQVLAPDALIILVATHIDERSADFNYERFKGAYPQLVGSIGVSNKTGAGIVELRQLIATEAAKLELMEQQWPQSWVQVESALQQDERYHINSYDYIAICAQNGVKRSGEQATLGGYLHDLGKILYFQDDDALSDFVVLKPNWLTQTMARVLDDAVTRDTNLGVLNHHDFRRLWPEHEANMRYERRLYPLFHRLLERFLLCYRLENETQGQAQSLVPLLLPHTLPANLPAWSTVLSDQPQIRMLFKLDFVPPGIMSWFIVLSHHYSQNFQWREGVRLRYEGHEADVVLNASTRELWLQVRGPAPSNFFSLLNHMINDRIIRRYFEGLSYKRQIPCTCAQCKARPDAACHFFDYDRLAAQKQRGKRLTVACELSDEEVSILELLEGIHHSTYHRIEEKLDAIHGIVSSDHDLLVQNLQLSEQLTREATRMWNLLTSNLSSESPSTFLLMPGDRSKFNPRNLFDIDFTLYLLCQHPAGPHLVKGEKGYTVPHSREWWTNITPWLRELIKYLKYVPKASGIAQAYDENYYKTIELNVEIFKTALEITPNFKDDLARHEIERFIDMGKPHEMQGSALRALHAFLREVDTTQHWCDLRKVATNDGNILWLCAEHAAFHGI